VVVGDVDDVGAAVAVVVDVVDVSGARVGSVVSDVVVPWSASGAVVPAHPATTVTRAAMPHSPIEARPESRMTPRVPLGAANATRFRSVPEWGLERGEVIAMHVVDLMTTELIQVSPETGIKEAARLMSRHRVSGLPVVDPEGRLVGIITEADFLRIEVARDEDDDPEPIETVSQVMSSDVVTISPDAGVSDAARIMATQDIKRLPVVGDDRRLLGIISRMDVVAVFTRPDEVVEDEIREDLLRRVMFVDPDQIDVTVSNGVVSFSGEIGTRNEARLLEELARRLDGVTRVENRLTWRLDDTGSRTTR
jgi:CBS-domain-containing membrane protein